MFHPDDGARGPRGGPQAARRGRDLGARASSSSARPATVNPDLPTGEVELRRREFDLLADAETPPFQIDEDDQVAEELRLRYRYLDLRRA